jgi:hypothetical protein
MITLNYSVLERNDSKVLTLTDTSTGWGTDTDINFTSIRALSNLTYAITAIITINTTDSSTLYDQIDLYSLTATTPFVSQSNMVFPIDATKLTISASALGDINTLLPDGIWDIQYNLLHYVGGAWTIIHTITQSVLVYGQTKTAVYNRLRQVPDLDETGNSYRDIQEALFYYTYLQAIEKSAFIAKKVDLLQMLQTLERLLLNGSNYPW